MKLLDYFEQKANALKPVIAYVGRFSPAGQHHVDIFNELKSLSPNVYILTSNPKKLNDKNPIDFKTKKEILTILGVPVSRIKELKGSGYNIDHILNSLGKKEDVILCIAVGEKDFESGEKVLESKVFSKIGNISKAEKTVKQKKGAYILKIPTIKSKSAAASSSQLRKFIKENKWNDFIRSYKEKSVAEKIFKIMSPAITQEEEYSEGTISHISHVEDLFIEKGIEGFIKSIRSIYGLLNNIYGKSTRYSLSEKIDGRVSVIFGKDSDNNLFVGNKSAFAGKAAKSEEEIRKYYGGKGDLAEVLIKVFNIVKTLNIPSKTFYQGDLLWASPSDITRKEIDGDTHYFFTPNVVTYSIPQKKIGNIPPMGIAVHTRYYANKDIKKSAAINRFSSDNLKSGGWFVFNPLRSTVDRNLSKSDYEKLKEKISAVTKNHAALKKAWAIFTNKKLYSLFPIFINSKIRSGNDKLEISDFDRFYNFVENELSKKLKTKSKIQEPLSYLKSHRKNFSTIVKYFNEIVEIKKEILKILKNYQTLTSYFDNKTISGEGWVILSPSGDAIKYVDRSEFSRLNFKFSKNKRKTNETN